MGREISTVVYIAGIGRSGSTLLGDMLAQLPGFVCLGELEHVWTRGLLENRYCGCGEAFDNCTLWDEIFSIAFGGRNSVDAAKVAHMIKSQLRSRRLLSSTFTKRRLTDDPVTADLGIYVRALYSAIYEVTGAKILVDTSKSPVYGRFLAEILALDLRFVHLIRDPRAVSYSWRRRKRNPISGEEEMRMGLTKSSALWLAWNIASSKLLAASGRDLRYMRLRYEDLMFAPQSKFKEVVDFSGEVDAGRPFLDDRSIQTEPNHILSGNFTRFEHGRIELIADMEWKERMHSLHKAWVSLLTIVGLKMYTYPIWQ